MAGEYEFDPFLDTAEVAETSAVRQLAGVCAGAMSEPTPMPGNLYIGYNYITQAWPGKSSQDETFIRLMHDRDTNLAEPQDGVGFHIEEITPLEPGGTLFLIKHYAFAWQSEEDASAICVEYIQDWNSPEPEAFPTYFTRDEDTGNLNISINPEFYRTYEEHFPSDNASQKILREYAFGLATQNECQHLTRQFNGIVASITEEEPGA